MVGSSVNGRYRQIDDRQVPTFIYGTAWKEEQTAPLVTQALQAGFRGIDTANQRRHYNEAEVGRALQAAFSEGTAQKADVFVQTKFTFRPAQDHRLPYDPAAPIAEQVPQSFESSLSHFGLDHIDSYILHGPLGRWSLTPADFEAWAAMESLHKQGKTQFIGVSNFSADQLRQLLSRAKVRPAFVQNRCYAVVGWDAEVRAVCDAQNIVYQGFSLLTANLDALRAPVIQAIARRHGRTVAQIVFRFALEVGMIPLTGTSNPIRMREDLQIYEFELAPEEVRAIENL